MKTLSFAKTSLFSTPVKVLYLLKGISCNHDYSAFRKYMVETIVLKLRAGENDPHADGPRRLADTLNIIIIHLPFNYIQLN